MMVVTIECKRWHKGRYKWETRKFLLNFSATLKVAFPAGRTGHVHSSVGTLPSTFFFRFCISCRSFLGFLLTMQDKIGYNACIAVTMLFVMYVLSVFITAHINLYVLTSLFLSAFFWILYSALRILKILGIAYLFVWDTRDGMLPFVFA